MTTLYTAIPADMQLSDYPREYNHQHSYGPPLFHTQEAAQAYADKAKAGTGYDMRPSADPWRNLRVLAIRVEYREIGGE